MITWMQRHNKYLVVTIWIATIAFIGAGVVGWGSVSFGSKANSVAKVGDIDIPITKYNYNRDNLYQQYAQQFGGKFDKEKAEELGLNQQVLNNLRNEALILNFAKERGIITTDKEVGEEIVNLPYFRDKSGKFDKSIYEAFLRNRGLKAKDFERILKDETTVRKVFKLINIKPLPLEKNAMKLTFDIADKIKYRVIKSSDINVTIDEDKLKSFWEKRKLDYMSAQKYVLELQIIDSKDVNVSDSDIESYYRANRTNYIDKSGAIKELKDVKDLVKKDVKLKKLKTEAARARSKFKKGKVKPTEVVTLSSGDKRFSKEIWSKIASADEGKYLNSEIVGEKYYNIHIKSIIKPKVMSFDEAKDLVTKDYKKVVREKELNSVAKDALKDTKSFNIEPKEYISLSKLTVLPKLTPQDSVLLTRSVFASKKKINSAKISDGVVVYEIVKQKIVDNNSSNRLTKEIESVKSGELTSNLIKSLSSKYSSEVYIKVGK